MPRRQRSWIALLGLALLVSGTGTAAERAGGASEPLQEILTFARFIAYHQDLAVDLSRADEGLMAIAFSSDGIVVVHQVPVLVFHFFRKGRTLEVRSQVWGLARGGDAFERQVQGRLGQRIEATRASFLETLGKAAIKLGTRLRPAGSRVLSLLLNEDSVDLGSDPLLEAYGRESLDRFRSLPDAITFRASALEHRRRGEYVQARGLLERTLEAHRRMLGDDHPWTVGTADELALVRMELGDTPGALVLFKVALEGLAGSTGLRTSQGATTLLDFGSLQLEVGDLDAALATVERALEIHTKVAKPDPTRAQIHNVLGLILFSRGELDQAQQHLERALEIFGTARGGLFGGPDPRDRLPAEVNLGHVLLARGDLTAALHRFEKTREEVERLLPPGHPQRVTLLFLLASVYELRGKISSAVDALELGLDAQEQAVASILPSGSERERALFLRQQSGYLDAAVSFQLRAAPADPRPARLVLAAILGRKARLSEAEFRLRFSERETDREDLLAAQRELRQLEAAKARLYWSDRRSPGSEERRSEDARLDQAIEQAAGRLATLAASLDHYLSYQELDQKLRDGKTQDRRQRESGTELSPEEIAEAGLLYHALAGKPWASPPLEEVQAAVPEGAALVELLVYQPRNPTLRPGKSLSFEAGERRYAAYVLDHGCDPRAIDLGEAAIIDQAALDLRKAIAARASDLRVRARKLDALTLGKIQPLLAGAKSLFLAPDGELNLVPFAALIDPEGRYRIEDYEISVVASGRELLTFGAPQVPSEEPLILGGIDFGSPSGPPPSAQDRGSPESLVLSPLPATEQEAMGVGALLGVAQGRILLGAAATEAAIKAAKGPRLLHIATHGLFLEDSPSPLDQATVGTLHDTAGSPSEGSEPMLRSALALAGFNRRTDAGNAEDGVLTALEVASLDLRGTEVVVLSACDTGVGAVQNGEGVFGLRRALAIAGARSQVISLWQVADQATKDLMLSWYQQILAGIPRAKAMRNVQLAALRGEPLPGTKSPLGRGGKRIELEPGTADPTVAGTRHPYYWAAFLVSGDPGPLSPPGPR